MLVKLNPNAEYTRCSVDYQIPLSTCKNGNKKQKMIQDIQCDLALLVSSTKFAKFSNLRCASKSPYLTSTLRVIKQISLLSQLKNSLRRCVIF